MAKPAALRDHKGHIIDPYTGVPFPNLATDDEGELYWTDLPPPKIPDAIADKFPTQTLNDVVMLRWHSEFYWVDPPHQRVDKERPDVEPSPDELRTLPLNVLEDRMHDTAMRIIYADVIKTRDPGLAKWIAEQKRGRAGTRQVGEQEQAPSGMDVRVMGTGE